MKGILAAATLIGVFVGCQAGQGSETGKTDRLNHVVTLGMTDAGNYRLFVDGEPFYVKGGGCEFGDISALAAHGGNSFRTWRTENGQKTARQVLDEAHDHGLLVMMGIEVGRERHGYDYNDTAWVQSQFERIKKEVEAIKDHPAILGWGIGNELNLRATNLKVWDAVEEIAKMIKEVDGNHVITTMLSGIDSWNVSYIEANCPHLDFLSIQMYGDMLNLPDRIKESGYEGPYLVTEWGATGHWEMPATPWGSAIEPTSTEKAASIKERYEKAIASDDQHCLGSYVFLWGQKQERTPTWYGLFTEAGEQTEAIDVMHYLWNGQWPDNRAPQVHDPLLSGKTRFEHTLLEPGATAAVTFNATDPDGDALQVRAEVMPEVNDPSDGGDPEERPESIKGLVEEASLKNVTFKAPSQPGAYRILVYITDGHNHAATFNIPFRVVSNTASL